MCDLESTFSNCDVSESNQIDISLQAHFTVFFFFKTKVSNTEKLLSFEIQLNLAKK